MHGSNHRPTTLCCSCVSELMVDAEQETREQVMAQEMVQGRCHICGSVAECWTPASSRDVTSLCHDPELGPPHWDAYLLGCRCRDCHTAMLEMIELLQGQD